MTGKTNAQELAIVRHLLGGAAKTQPTGPFHIVLLTGDEEAATNAASLSNELAGGGYSRQAATFTDGVNDADVEFGPATGADWTGLTHFAILATGTDEIVYTGTLTGSPITVPVGQSYRLAAGQIVVTEG